MARFRILSATIKALAGLFTVFAAILVVWSWGPIVETKFWPAVSKLVVDKTEWNGTESTKIWVHFTKLRNCEFVGITWYKGKATGEFTRVAVVTRSPNDDSNPNRATGTQAAGPWTIALNPVDLRTDSFAQLLHRCHPFWTTTTDFFP